MSSRAPVPSSPRRTDATQDDTIRMPWLPTGTGEYVVRPALAILYRLVLGPFAGRWVSRFLRYERDGRVGLRWHWPAFAFPAAWAFYRKLWGAGTVFAALPFAGALVLRHFDLTIGDEALVWLACAFGAVWGMPGVVGACAASRLLFRSVQRDVFRAEAATDRTDRVASLLCARRRAAPWLALALSAAVVALFAKTAMPGLERLYDQRVVRARVAAGVAAAAPLKRQVEEQWERNGSLPRRPDYAAVKAERGAQFLERVELSTATGRVRLALGPATGEASGKALLLAPAVDAERRIHWYCIPIDVPARLLPEECRSG
jgi:hypothetical protein